MDEKKDWTVKPYKYKAPFPWFSVFYLGMVWFIIMYQISPEFQAWVNYTWRYWSRYATYSAQYSTWIAKRAWRKIPNG